MKKFYTLILLAPLVLVACGGGDKNPRQPLPKKIKSDTQARKVFAGGIYKIGTPYKIEGDWYRPRENTKYDNVGIASWYGEKFNGRRTANGELFDMRLLTAAHPTLPMPIEARVTNLENGRSIVVRINDRGPFAKDREIDLSRRAAQELGFYKKGTARVRVQYMRRAPLYNARGRLIDGKERQSFVIAKPATPRNQRQIIAAPTLPVETQSLDGSEIAPTRTLYAVQVGAFGERANAERLRDALRANFPNRVVEIEEAGAVFRVKTGSANIREDAAAIATQLKSSGYGNAIVIDLYKR